MKPLKKVVLIFCRQSYSRWFCTGITVPLTTNCLKGYINCTGFAHPQFLRLKLTASSLIDQIIIQLTNVLTLETLPELSPWSWHVGAWNHYRTAIILLEEVSVHPDMQKADKIWRILDYIFLQPPGLTSDEKSIAILSQAKERLSVYSGLKKMKVPATLDVRVCGPM